MFKKDELPFLGILRGISRENISPLVDICKIRGIKYLEVTMNTDGAYELIREMTNVALGEIKIGAGTVLTMKDLQSALDAGAEFIVCPSLVEDIVTTCVREKVPVFPGALTPTEVHKAWNMGASMVKIFPAGLFGPEYFKMLKAPFNSVKLLAVGGINKQNIKFYFENGADAVAFGAGVFIPELLNKSRYADIAKHLDALVRVYRGDFLT
jgi:2-dehydro-3-deoxyphosphogluconate aldolase / (4S)-4-hydroxy-2-oxoglutarate aldolase